MENQYNPHKIEQDLLNFWNSNHLFLPTEEELETKEPYLIFMPPPNVTNVLHLGHALNNTIQDVMARYYRMRNKAVVWKVGVDHAGLATENMVEKHLSQKNIPKNSLTQEEFLQHVWDWKDQYGSVIVNQLKRLGVSGDWDNLRFTMDEVSQEAVKKIFVSLYQDNLIYRSEYIINWCISCLTALSEEEVESQPFNGYLYHLIYFVEGESSPLVIATTRPETIFGDVAIAVHPDDPRYKKVIGKKAVVPITNKLVPIIADERVEINFGTGVLKITPSHDITDFEIGQKHQLPLLSVIEENGKMNENALHYNKMDRFEARKNIVNELRDKNLLQSEEPHEIIRGICYRCSNVVEKRVSEQWFLKMKPLAEKALNIFSNNEVHFYPKKWEKVYLHWLNNIQDWCISRQIWWGHRIPVQYCRQCNAINVSETLLTQCEKCSSNNLILEKDVLDTWFSSWIWPFTTLDWPRKNNFVEKFLPAQFVATAPEILFFWVARMIIAGLYLKDKVPFSTVYFNATICDKKGRKMSKSLGNGIDPLEIIESHGSDALRFTLLYLAPKGERIRIDKSNFDIGSRLITKIWNASRFLLSLDNVKALPIQSIQKDSWDDFILFELNQTIKKANESIEQLDYHKLTHSLYQFFWNFYCDWYIESSKVKINLKDNEDVRNSKYSVLIYVLDNILRLFHPVIPFITEHIWQKLPLKASSLSIVKAPYPQEEKIPIDTKIVNILKDIIYKIRNIKADLGLQTQGDLEASFFSDDKTVYDGVKDNEKEIKLLAKIASIQFEESPKKFKNSLVLGESEYVLYIHLTDVFDFEKQKDKVRKEIQKTEQEIERALKNLNNSSFMSNASEDLKAQEHLKYSDYTKKKSRLQDLLKQL